MTHYLAYFSIKWLLVEELIRFLECLYPYFPLFFDLGFQPLAQRALTKILVHAPCKVSNLAKNLARKLTNFVFVAAFSLNWMRELTDHKAMAQMIKKEVIKSLLLATNPTIIALRIEAIAHRVIGIIIITFLTRIQQLTSLSLKLI